MLCGACCLTEAGVALWANAAAAKAAPNVMAMTKRLEMHMAPSCAAAKSPGVAGDQGAARPGGRDREDIAEDVLPIPFGSGQTIGDHIVAAIRRLTGAAGRHNDILFAADGRAIADWAALAADG